MDDVDIFLQVLAGTFLSIGICMLGYCIRKTRKPMMKQSSSMEDLTGMDPQPNDV